MVGTVLNYPFTLIFPFILWQYLLHSILVRIFYGLFYVCFFAVDKVQFSDASRYKHSDETLHEACSTFRFCCYCNTEKNVTANLNSLSPLFGNVNEAFALE